jgi:predicted Fe-Mo cluster-binding NifX family protein
MRIAVTYENGQVFQHFGHTERFKVYDIENGKVTIATVVNTNGSGHGALADILKKIGVDTLICGGIGGGAVRALAEAGITLYAGVAGDADKAVEAFLSGKLAAESDATCGHHGEHHDETCHGHGCGEHHRDAYDVGALLRLVLRPSHILYQEQGKNTSCP